MEKSGVIRKMRTELASPIQYFLPINTDEIALTPLVGSTIELSFTGTIHCPSCKKKIKKLYGGYCFDCLNEAPEAAECIMKPELCEAHLGKGRDVAWEERNHNTPHYVYFALSSDVKVGVTRSTQIPTRWIDQGASAAIPFAKTPNRYLAGMIEVDMKQYMTDKTSWQKMLKNEVLGADLAQQKEFFASMLDPKYAEYITTESEVTILDFPVEQYPIKINSTNFDKDKVVSGILKGIKGQYLIFEDGLVINLRRHEGYEIVFKTL
jgi:hypothetical protein